jgi:DNA polymerase-3 subunit gamma/tau
MLGSVDLSFIYQLLDAVMANDATAALSVVGKMSEHAPDFEASVDELISLIHRVAIAQAVPKAVDNNWGDAERIVSLASGITQEDAQLFYQVAINGKRDIGMAADPRAGFEMLVLRMIAFRPAAVLDDTLGPDDLVSVAYIAPPPVSETVSESVAVEVDTSVKKPHEAPVVQASEFSAPASMAETPIVDIPAVANAVVQGELHSLTPATWSDTLAELGLVGIVYNIASNCELRSREGSALEFVLDESSSGLFNEGHAGKIRMALENYFAVELKVVMQPGAVSGETPAMTRTRLTAERQSEAVAEIEGDPVLQQLIERFDGELDHASIVPVEPRGEIR